MKNLMIILFLGIIQSLSANPLDEANKLITDKNYSAAIETLEAYTDSVEDISAIYNLGLAYHHNGYHGKAIWAFERILKQNPKDDGAIEQITSCTKELDEAGEWQPIAGNFASSIYSFGSGTWSTFTIVLALFSALMFYVWRSKKGSDRSFQFAISFIGSAFFLIITFVAAYYSDKYEKETYCIAVKESHRMEKKGSSYSPTKMVILEGSRMKVIHEIDSNYLEVSNTSNETFIVSLSDFKSF
jgi:tetratricopeptide (TPR) repeat protein